MLNILVLINPFMLEMLIVKSSGIEVAYPAIFPTVLGFKFRFSANFLKVITKIYFAINTMSPEYKINLTISKNIFFSPL